MRQPFIVAEIAQGYEGSKRLVELYVEAASSSGADAVKFQIFYADELALPDYKYYKLFRSLELPFEVWKNAVEQSHKKGMEFYSDVLGVKSFKNLEKIEVDGYKIHTSDINNIALLKSVAISKKKIFLSTGGCQLDEIERPLEILNECNVTLMHGFQAEPTEFKDNNLNRIKTLKKIFKKPVGFQDHTAGGSELALYIPFVAMGVGASVIEKHLTLSRKAKIEDYISALTPEEFALWCRKIKKAYVSLGKKGWKLTKKELSYRVKARRAICSLRNINKGGIIQETNVVLKRTNSQNSFFDISEVIGKKARRFIEKNSVIKKEDLL